MADSHLLYFAEPSEVPTDLGAIGGKVRRALAAAVPELQRGGVMWWEGSEDSWSALFDSNFVARPALQSGFAP